MSRSADALRRRQSARRGFVGRDRRESRRAAGRAVVSAGRAAGAVAGDAARAAARGLVLRYQEDLTPEEIAATLEAPLATVKSNLQRGLKLLRAKAESNLKDYIRPGQVLGGA